MSWFEVADSELMSALTLTRNTIKAARIALVSAGYIEARNPGHRAKMQYRLIDLTANKVSNFDTSNNDISNNDDQGVKISQLRYQNLSTTQSTETDNNNDDNLSKSDISKIDTLEDVIRLYTVEIEPVTPTLRGILAKAAEDFGLEELVQAIIIAVKAGREGRKWRFIEGTLEKRKEKQSVSRKQSSIVTA